MWFPLDAVIREKSALISKVVWCLPSCCCEREEPPSPQKKICAQFILGCTDFLIQLWNSFYGDKNKLFSCLIAVAAVYSPPPPSLPPIPPTHPHPHPSPHSISFISFSRYCCFMQGFHNSETLWKGTKRKKRARRIWDIHPASVTRCCRHSVEQSFISLCLVSERNMEAGRRHLNSLTGSLHIRSHQKCENSTGKRWKRVH